MGKARAFGLMEVSIRGTGFMIWLKVMEHSIMQMGMCTMDSFTKIRLLDMEHMFIKVDRSMKECGRMTNRMVKEMKCWKMAVTLKVCIVLVRKKGKVLLNGPMVVSISVIGLTIILKDKVSIHGQMVEFISEPGKIIN